MKKNIVLLALLAIVSLCSAQAALANATMRISANQIGQTYAVEIGQNKSLIVDLPVSAKEVIVSEPTIANAIIRTKRRAIIQGRNSGDTNVIFLDVKGNPIAILDVTVGQSGGGLEQTLARLLPGSSIQATMAEDRVVLSGSAQSDDDVQKAIAIAQQVSNNEVVSIINIAGSQQVMLKVIVAEVQRETVKQLGIDLNASLNVGGVATSLLTSPGLGGVSNVVASNSGNLGFSFGNLSVDATIRALERRGALRTLAEPTLTAISGKSAEFLAGGEFPVPVGYDDGEITYEFKEFGVELNFTPTVHSNNAISLDVETKVSELNAEGGYTAGPVSIPATKERRAKTSVKLPSGATLALAGLIEEKSRQRFNEVPGLGKIPVLGALFRSRDFVRAETELLILVTPYLTAPGHLNDYTLPTDKMEFAGDAEAVFLGQMEKLYGVGDGPKGLDLKGGVGFVLD
ncbi:type II and III secretion system protein family protein [Maritalea mediterranea]|uniref:Type II and III secretion system protein family protein n=1 Tax=Maritalea mediterranea TaxID=2909667 RepID=A0ABS9E7R8_9HYPH|nr:type II and III secretion system protein family protein [Maritalea mediterranea]MCF4097473.1 type II and III secretion system protein family protein [Maritalea mediterranea]